MRTSTFTIPFILLTFLLCCQPLLARHIVGGEMTYECLGDDPSNPGNRLYLITMKVYKDCAAQGQNVADFDSAPGQNTGTASLYRGDDLNNDLGPIELDAPVVTEVNPQGNNPCIQVPANVCLEQGVYVFTQSLPVSSASYHVVYQRCCRNATIDNIWSPDEQGGTYTIEITPSAQQFCNNSPTFSNFPPPVICVNENINFDHSATDAEGDQLIYEFCSPLKGGAQNDPAPFSDDPPPYEGVDFIIPTYTANAPLAGNPVVVIDPITGIITGNPTLESQYVVGICVSEFRNGELLSRVQRDFQFNVTYCEPLVNADLGTGINAGNAYVIESCIDSTITIINQSTDPVYIFEYLWEFDIENSQPLSFDERDITVTFPGPGRYLGTMTLNPGTQCTDMAVIDITITSPINPDFTFTYDTCVAGPVEFMDLTPDREWEIVEYLWDFDDGNTSTDQNPIHQYLTPGLKDVTLRTTDIIGCSETVTRSVNWYPVPPLIIIDPSSEIGCPPEEVVFTNLSTPIDTTYDIVWDFGDGTITNELSPTHIYMVPDIYTITVEITSPIGCFTSDVFKELIFIDSIPVADFVFDPPMGSSNFSPEITFQDQSFRDAAWEWNFGDFSRSIRENPTFVFPDTGQHEVQLYIQSFYGCEDSITYMVDIEPKVTFFMPNAFTPNNDALNEEFKPAGFFRGITNYNMRIWDRWGGLYFETDDINTGWNGRKGNTGKMAPSGVYIYHITLTEPRGAPMEYKGFSTVIR